MSGKAGKNINLATLLTPEGMAPILSSPEVQKQLKAILPPGVPVEKIIKYIQKALASPKFQQALAKLSSAPGQLGSLLATFGPQASKGTDQEEVEALARAMQEESGEEQPLNLTSALTPEVMTPILANPEVQAKLKPFLPPGVTIPQTPEEIQKALASPEFQKALTLLSAATASEQLQAVMEQFGLPEEAVKAANSGDLDGLAKTLQGFAKPKKEKKGK